MINYRTESRLTRGEKTLFRVLEGEVIAIFPNLPGDMNPNTCLSYMHIGQHSSCDKSLIDELLIAKLGMCEDLIEELQSMGYELIMPDYGLETIK